jgi:hypothetical protein
MFGVDGQYDIVRATFDDGTNVPRIPPQRVGGGAFWRDPNWFVRVGLLHAFPQNDIAANETPTAGYNLLKAVVSYTKVLENGPAEITLGWSATTCSTMTSATRSRLRRTRCWCPAAPAGLCLSSVLRLVVDRPDGPRPQARRPFSICVSRIPCGIRTLRYA